MAETPEIKITIDQDALRQQVEDTLQGVLQEASLRLRQAADDLDGGAWWREQEVYWNRAVADALAEGRDSAQAEIDRLSSKLASRGGA